MLRNFAWLLVLVCLPGCGPNSTTSRTAIPSETAVNDSVSNDATSAEEASSDKNSIQDSKAKSMSEPTLSKATFGAGCYWCTEAVFQRLQGVDGIVSGFMGGQVDNPSYEAVCSGTTGHAEVIHFDYDSSVISFEELLEVFWKTHDPTTLNQQGADIGTQYRSVVYFHSDEQKDTAEKYKQKLNEANAYGKPVVTEISPATKFYAANPGHQNYYNENPKQGYCSYVIQPKVEKVKKVFADKLKKSE